MMKMKINTTLPEAKGTIFVPEGLDPKAVEVALNALIGAFVAISKVPEADRRRFLLRFVGSLVSEVRDTVTASSVNSTTAQTNAAKAIEDLLRSLHKNDKP